MPTAIVSGPGGSFRSLELDIRDGPAVYNIGGGRISNCSMLEAIALGEAIAERELAWQLSEENRDRNAELWMTPR